MATKHDRIKRNQIKYREQSNAPRIYRKPKKAQSKNSMGPCITFIILKNPLFPFWLNFLFLPNRIPYFSKKMASRWWYLMWKKCPVSGLVQIPSNFRNPWKSCQNTSYTPCWKLPTGFLERYWKSVCLDQSLGKKNQPPTSWRSKEISFSIVNSVNPF